MADSNLVQSIMNVIRQHESGGDYEAYNADGDAHGAYQFQPETFASVNEQFGGDGSWSPQNQDRMAYAYVNNILDQYGGDPRQVFSIWYSGLPNKWDDTRDQNGYPSIAQYVSDSMNELQKGGTTGTFNFGPTGSGMNMKAYMRTSDPNEKFDQQSIMNILGQPDPSSQRNLMYEYATSPQYGTNALQYGEGVREFLQPHMDKMDALYNQQEDNKANAASLQDKLIKYGMLANLIGGSNNTTNRQAYAALGKAFLGFDVPDGTDQFVSGAQLFENQQKQQNADRDYALKKEQLDLQKQSMALKALMGSGSGGGRGGSSKGGSSSGLKQSDYLAIINKSEDYASEHPGEYNPFELAARKAEAGIQTMYGTGYDTEDEQNDYGATLSDYTGLLEQNADKIRKGDSTALDRAGIEAYARGHYGDFADTLLENTTNSKDYNWGHWGIDY